MSVKAWSVTYKDDRGGTDYGAFPVHAATAGQAISRSGIIAEVGDDFTEFRARRVPALDDQPLTPYNLVQLGGWDWSCGQCGNENAVSSWQCTDAYDNDPNAPNVLTDGVEVYCSLECLEAARKLGGTEAGR